MIFNSTIKFPKPSQLVFGLSLTLALSGISAPMRAATSLAEDQHITHSLMSAAVGDVIRKNCPSISARIFVAFSKVKELERYALGLGFSKAEIDAFISSKSERKRIRQATEDYLQKNGVVEGKKETYCSLGRAEIADGSLIGQLLWSWK